MKRETLKACMEQYQNRGITVLLNDGQVTGRGKDCVLCGGYFDEEEIREAAQRGRRMYNGQDGFICPCCYHSFLRMPLAAPLCGSESPGEDDMTGGRAADPRVDLRMVRGILLKYLAISGMTYKDLGFAAGTWSYKKNNPDLFTRAELQRICRKLHIPNEEKVQLI